jgi:hypothetical protein
VKLENIRSVGLLVVAAFVVATAAGGCGGGGGDGSSTTGAAKSAAATSGSEYEEVLAAMRETAAEAGSYDAYGFAEYMPSTQRAAIDAFCFVADAIANQGGPAVPAVSLWPRVVRKAETDLKSERDIVAPARAHRAIAKLRAVQGLESLDPDLAARYVHACYR